MILTVYVNGMVCVCVCRFQEKDLTLQELENHPGFTKFSKMWSLWLIFNTTELMLEIRIRSYKINCSNKEKTFMMMTDTKTTDVAVLV